MHTNNETVPPSRAAQTELLDKPATAQLLGISVRTLDGLMQAKKVPYLRISRKLIRFVRADVLDYLRRSCRVAARGESNPNP